MSDEDLGDEPGSELQPWEAVSSLRRFFLHRDLPVPPIPERFCDRLVEGVEGTWSTEPVEPKQIYLMHVALLGQQLFPEGESYAVSFHFSENVAITLRVTLPNLLLAVQVLSGGVYLDNERCARDVVEMLDAARRCLDIATASTWDRPACVIGSKFRSIGFVGWAETLRHDVGSVVDPAHRGRWYAEGWEALPPLLEQLASAQP